MFANRLLIPSPSNTKLCGTVPLFVTLNRTLPAEKVVGISMANSVSETSTSWGPLAAVGVSAAAWATSVAVSGVPPGSTSAIITDTLVAPLPAGAKYAIPV